MAIHETTLDAPAHWPSVEKVLAAATDSTLVILPEEIVEAGAAPIVAFRSETQAIRVYAKKAGVQPLLLYPPGAEVVSYTEQAATWVLPTLISAALMIPGTIAADVITHHILEHAQQDTAQPTVRYQEAYVENGRLRIRQLEGPADELARLLRERCSSQSLPRLQDDFPEDSSQSLPRLQDDFPEGNSS